MMERVETRLDGPRLIVRIPMRFQRRGGRKRIAAPDGSELAPSSKPQPSGTLVKALARARRWQRMLEEGRFGTLAELADAERLSRSYVCRVLRLTLLAPDIVERILDGRPTAGLAQLMKPFAVQWERQRDHLL
jgi:ParB-like chromosome segregation protein Spo0J